MNTTSLKQLPNLEIRELAVPELTLPVRAVLTSSSQGCCEPGQTLDYKSTLLFPLMPGFSTFVTDILHFMFTKPD